MRKLLLLLIPAALFAQHQQTTITSTNKATAPLSGAPYGTVGTFQMVWRIAIPAGSSTSPAWVNPTYTFQLPNGLNLKPAVVVAGSTWQYTIVDNSNGQFHPLQFGCPIVAFATDLVFRYQRFATVSTCESWNVDGSNYQIISSAAYTSFTPGLTGGNLQLGDATYNQGTIAFWRGYSTTVPLNSLPPFGGTGGDLWDYEFNGNLNDSSSNHVNMTATGTFTYSPAPTYPPACVTPAITSVEIFHGPVTLPYQCYPLDGGNTLTYSPVLATTSTLVYALTDTNGSAVTGTSPPGSVTYGGTNNSVMTPVSAWAAGTYQTNLTVTDGSAQSSTFHYKVGVVNQSATGAVNIPNAVHAAILGKMMTAVPSYSPLAQEPIAHLANAWLLDQKMTNPNISACPPLGPSPCQHQFFDFWNQPLAGTITVYGGRVSVSGSTVTYTSGGHDFTGLQTGKQIYVNGTVFPIATPGTGSVVVTGTPTQGSTYYGSREVVGSGTTFTTTFCQGPGSPTVPIDSGTTIVAWYPILAPYGLPGGTTGRRMGTVQSCADDTHMNVAFTSDGTSAWLTDTNIGAASGLGYAYVEQGVNLTNGIGGWLINSYPGNYYDNVMALYAAYYRTGIDDFLIAARVLADRWWTSPQIDKGITYEPTFAGGVWGSIASQRRSLALTGLFLRTNDSPPYSYDPGLRTFVGVFTGTISTVTCPVGPTVTCPVGDEREDGYSLAYTALYAAFGTDATTISNSMTAVANDVLHRWGPCQTGPDGVCGNNEDLGNVSSWQGGGSAVTISGSVVTTPGTFNSGDFSPPIVISSATAANPMVLTLASAPPGVWINQYIGIKGATGTGCSGMNISTGLLVTGISGNNVTVSFNGSGCTYTASSGTAILPSACWFTGTGTTQPTSNAQGDAAWTYCTWTDSTHLHTTDLTGTPINYAGAQTTNIGWETMTAQHANDGPSWLGIFVQPYQTGIQNQAYWDSHLAMTSVGNACPLGATCATTDAALSTYAQANAAYLLSTALDTRVQGGITTNGPVYAISPDCPNGGIVTQYLSGHCNQDVPTTRMLNSETLNIATVALRFNPLNATAKSVGNTLYRAAFAQSGDPGYDGAAIYPLIEPGGFFYYTGTQHKWLGAFFGVGSDWSWAATSGATSTPQSIRSPKSILPSGAIAWGWDEKLRPSVNRTALFAR